MSKRRRAAHKKQREKENTMRDRKKKHLSERLAACESILYTPVPDDLNFVTSVQKPDYIDLDAYFGRTAPVELEIGCGKGRFMAEKAKRSPEINFIAVEKIGNVLVTACETALRENLANVLFVKCDAHMLPKYLPEYSIDRIYLNFSCPYPKKRDANRRLTYPAFLDIYRHLLTPGGEIHMKTDNMHFFEYSLEQFSREGFQLKNISLDLHAGDCPNNIMTEYESRFVSLGQPIYRVEAYLPIG